MKSNILISVIIPIYNTEKYIEKTLKSLKNQTKNNFEIILVNDGTEDNSIEIAIELLKDTNIDYKIINQINQGQSKARNIGIENAKGDYILFLDSDDYIDEKLIEIVEKNISDDLEVLLYDYKRVKACGEVIENKEQAFKEFNREIEGKVVFDAYKNNKLRIWTSSLVYNRLYIRENNIKFLEAGHAAEDLGYIFKAILKAKKVKCITDELSYYYQREDSLTNKPDINKNITVVDSMEDVCLFIEKNIGDKELIDIIKYEFIPEHIMYQILGVLNSNNTAQMRRIIKQPKVRKYLRHAKKDTTRYGSSVYMWIKMASTSATVFMQVFLKKTGR